MTSDTADPRLVTGAWRDGDLVGFRRFAEIGDVELESGFVLPAVRVAYETWGEFDGSNAVLILHALTGDSHVHGPAGPGHPTAGWWDTLVGPGRPIDTERFFVVAPNILGGCQGTTGPASTAPDGRAWGSRFPYLTVRDQVAAEVALADQLGVEHWYGIAGGSAGGMRALEWAVMEPQRVERLFLLATCAAASANQIALSGTQNSIIRADAHFAGGDYYEADFGPVSGLDLARRVAHIFYRSERELHTRFGREPQGGEVVAEGGRFAVESYLHHHGAKLVERFDANSYVVLSEAMNSHDIGRARGGVRAALSQITAQTIVSGITSDRLYPLYQQHELAEHIGTSGPVEVIDSSHGHDGFLIEFDQVGKLTERLLA